jgi:hypothetical protein
MQRHPLTPSIVILVISSLGLGVILAAHIVTRSELSLINRFEPGLDYRDFYTASLMVRTGASPYAVGRYVTPPLGAIVNVPLTYFPVGSVSRVLSLVIFPAVLGAVLLVHKSLMPGMTRSDWLFLGIVSAIMLISYPFHFLVDRANIDGFVLLLMGLGIFALGRADSVAGMMFALAAGLKAYPILLALPLAARRRWTALAFLVATLTVFVLVTPDHWWRFVTGRLMERGGKFRIDENGSLAVTFFYFGSFLTGRSPQNPSAFVEMFERLSGPVYLALLAALLFQDVKSARSGGIRGLRACLVSYFPFMVAVPRLAYHYELVNLLALIPVATWGWSRSPNDAGRRVLLAIAVGVALSQFQAVAAEKLIGSSYPHFIPGLGLFIAMLAVVAARRLDLFRQTESIVRS